LPIISDGMDSEKYLVAFSGVPEIMVFRDLKGQAGVVDFGIWCSVTDL